MCIRLRMQALHWHCRDPSDWLQPATTSPSGLAGIINNTCWTVNAHRLSAHDSEGAIGQRRCLRLGTALSCLTNPIGCHHFSSWPVCQQASPFFTDDCQMAVTDRLTAIYRCCKGHGCLYVSRISLVARLHSQFEACAWEHCLLGSTSCKVDPFPLGTLCRQRNVCFKPNVFSVPGRVAL